MTVRYIKIAEMIRLLSDMMTRNVYFVDMTPTDESHLFFTPSKIPSEGEMEGDRILGTINFNEDEEEVK